MEFQWLKITPEIENGIKLINQVDNAKFQKFLLHIKDNSTTKPKNDIFSPEEMVSLPKVLRITPEEVKVLLKITLHILERMSKFVMRPSSISQDLCTLFKMDKDKADSFINVWKTLMKEIFEDYNLDNFGEVDQLVESKWQLNFAVGSHLNKNERLSSIMLNVKTTGDKPSTIDKTFLELTEEELLSLNSQLESAQLELDTIINEHLD